MEQFIVISLVFLGLLAVFDLFVGVSNDAVNFLNSAIGSRVAPFKVVMLVASLGVLLGATFSSGMMEIARSGVFNPQMFTFNEVMVIFIAVMVADVLLLDTFNSFGLPTSTTVSIIFELLGGAVAVAAYKLWTQDASLFSIGDYINSERALGIISGILISVVVAFVAGMVVQYVTRLLFTFRYQEMYKRIGALFGGIALTAIFYFLVMKGAKGASFMRAEYLEWINRNTLAILICAFIALSALFQCLIIFFRVNIFRIVILFGTFSLAFAFAGNDLVNFVGVPLAALESYTQFSISGAAGDAFTMEGLKNAVQTPTFYLLFSGLIMVLTLWFSKKAHRVVATSINLSSSMRGEEEQFGSSLPGRMIVRSAMRFGRIARQIFPQGLFRAIDSRMERPALQKGEIPLPFDQVRASINLMVASILIASATSLKLPLSTTYVTFMVAMGSSFADGAWDRESAVYRISGVLMVIGGWFITAVSAFSACALIAILVSRGGVFAIAGLMLLVTFLLIRSNFSKEIAEKSSFGIVTEELRDAAGIRAAVDAAVRKHVENTLAIFQKGLDSLLAEDERALRAAKNEAVSLFDDMVRWRGEYYRMALRGEGGETYTDARHYYYRIFSNMKEISHGLRSALDMMESHLANRHHVYKGTLRKNLLRMATVLETMPALLQTYRHGTSREDVENAQRTNDALQQVINRFQIELLRRIDEERLSLRSSEMYLNFLQFARQSTNRYAIVGILQRALDDLCARESVPERAVEN
ncbi:MAG: inorganic phosphate transporter [Desulfovibrio sp.]|jgi:phosphate/sulfate permease|nr:inorganic phosphate transporter [Desulfovibrio sp.]